MGDRLSGRVAIVTGAGMGIGRGIARRLARFEMLAQAIQTTIANIKIAAEATPG